MVDDRSGDDLGVQVVVLTNLNRSGEDLGVKVDLLTRSDSDLNDYKVIIVTINNNRHIILVVDMWLLKNTRNSFLRYGD